MSLRFLTTTEVGERLGLSADAVRERLERGEIRHLHPPNGQYRVREDWLDEYIDKITRGGNGRP